MKTPIDLAVCPFGLARCAAPLLGGIALAFAFATAQAQQKSLPLPEMVVAKCAVPPKIDGKIEPDEWDNAPACTGFVRAFDGTLAQLQTIARITYDDQFLYVCITNLRGAPHTLITKAARRPDDERIVFDDSNEIWISPPGTPARTYQTVFNTYPAVFDALQIPSLGYTAKSWSGKWEIASTESTDQWTIEARTPIKSFGVDRIGEGATWRALFCTDILDDGSKFRAWAAGGGFADIARHGFLHFKENSAVFQLLNIESIFTGEIRFPMAVTGPRTGQSTVSISTRFGGAIDATPNDFVLKKAVTVDNGAHQEFTLAGSLKSVPLPLTKEGRKKGFCEVTAKTDAGIVLYHQIFPFIVDGSVRTPPAHLKSSPYDTPLGLSAFYAPLNKKLIVKIDRLYLPRRNDAVAGTAKLSEPGSGKVVAQRAIAPFSYDYSEFPMDLAQLDVPIQTEQNWAKAKPVLDANAKVMDENKKCVAKGWPTLPLARVPGPQPVRYSLEVLLTGSDGAPLAEGKRPVQLLGYQFEWLPNDVGISDKVIPPWTPLHWESGRLELWNKTYQLDGLGLSNPVRNAGRKQLSEMKLVAVIEGKEITVHAAPATPVKVSEASAEFSGVTRVADLEVAVQTRAEFDGFVFNTLTLNPPHAVQLDRFSLVVTMPKAEAPCFVTTSGGWAAYYGWTPAHWDSRETSSNSRHGNFVPYIFLTDSDRGYCWFADTDEGWLLDPAQPTQELSTEGDTVMLRVNFVTKATRLQEPITIRYGWMVTPQKPQPPHWRGYLISNRRPFPQATPVFWNDADSVIGWAYYSSPFPHDYGKSKTIMEGPLRGGIVPCAGTIAHSIGSYSDYKGRTFTELAADWGESLGESNNGNVARSRGPNDFQLWHFDRWIQRSGLTGLYFDENYLGEHVNYLTGGAYILPDGSIQPAYSYLGLREYDKRLRYLFYERGKAIPNLWLHTTGGHAVYAWMPDVSMEGENAEPSGLENDYIDVLPASRLRSIGMGVNLGCAPFIMCQAQRHWNAEASPFLVRQFVGWVLAHDCLPEGVRLWETLSSELELWHDDTRFLPYWKSGQGIASSSPDILVSAHLRPGHGVLWIVNTAREDRRARVQLDLNALGFKAERMLAYDAETGERCNLRGDALSVEVPKRTWRAVRLVPRWY
jgi:hypothetical protein